MDQQQEQQTADLIIIGAGAAGMMTAIVTARQAPSLRIAILDGSRKIGAKIMVSGGGRCNVTNVRVTPSDFYGGNPNVIRNIIAAFDEKETVRFFSGIGVSLHEEDFGKLFPDSQSAKTVVACLLAELQKQNVRVESTHRVEQVSLTDEGFSIHADAASRHPHWKSKRLVIATGGLSLPKTGSDGMGYTFAQAFEHTMIETTPALDPILLHGSFHEHLSGIAHDMQFILDATKSKRVR
ncbi:MAG: aminoacetone oxidase family FAD-binding enzyme, partial [Phycisphaerae bacterium]